MFTIFIEYNNNIYSIIVAIILFLIAAFTDFIDGRIARQSKTVTLLGIFLDPLADKLLISTALIYFSNISSLGIPVWTVIVVLSRDFLVTGLRYTLANKNIIISANKFGKFKTVLQMLGVIIIMLILTINRFIAKVNKVVPIVFTLYNRYLLYIILLTKLPIYIMIIIIVFTIISGLNYICEYGEFFNEK
jgi:CDP-diacylglycerol--glycerol-3-phosphate 3-phosphatidyltransferase